MIVEREVLSNASTMGKKKAEKEGDIYTYWILGDQLTNLSYKPSGGR